MIWDFSRLPLAYQRYCHYARSICTFDFARLGIPRIDAIPITGDGTGWAHPQSGETGGPAFGVKVNDPRLRDWHLDYLGHQAPWALNSTAFKSKTYQKLGAGEWTLAVDLHEAMGHMIGFFIVNPDEAKQASLVDLFQNPAAANDHHVWIPTALKGFTPLSVPEVSDVQAARFKEIVLS